MGMVIGLLIMFFGMVLIFIMGLSPVIIKQASDSARIDPLPQREDNSGENDNNQ